MFFVVLPDTLLLDLAGPAEAFRLANQQCARRGRPPAFEMHHIGPVRRVTCSVGLGLDRLAPLPRQLPRGAWVVLLGRPGEAVEVVRHTPAWLQTRDWLGRQFGAHAAAAPRLLTVCVGALLAADAGLLAGRQVTTHHELLDDLARLAPTAQVCANRLWVQDGPVWTSAGITAGIDLALHAVEQELGEAVAAAVAEVMVVFHRRAADDPTHSPLRAGRNHLHAGLHRLQNALQDRPGEAWTLARMAELAHVTPRHLGRLFQQHVGCTPRQHVEQIRLAWMREVMARGQPVKRAAEQAGFRSERQWRRARARAAGPSGPG